MRESRPSAFTLSPCTPSPLPSKPERRKNRAMTERQLQFRIGIFAIVTITAAGVMVFYFGNLKSYWEPSYTVAIHFDSSPGVYPSTPVRRNGITIGSVREIAFDEQRLHTGPWSREAS